MKKILIGLLFIGFTSLSFSQKSSEVQEVKLADVVISPLNLDYLNKVQDKSTPEYIKQLENKTARYNIKESPVFDKNFEAYEVIFKESGKNNGRIVATYDNNGKILNSYEKFKNVTLPVMVRNAIYYKYPGWVIQSDKYLVSYYSDKEVKKEYKLKITKDNQKKTLKVDIEGNVI